MGGRRDLEPLYVGHDAIDQRDEYGYVTEIVAPTTVIDQFPRVAFLPKNHVLVEVFEEPRRVEMSRLGGPDGGDAGEAVLMNAMRL